MNYQPVDCHMMRRCLQLARQAIGKTSPNPMVGSVIVRDGEIVGEGFHPQAGQPHAEVFALQAAGEKAKGATVYVNLEPCNHYGRTPPCTEALIAANVAKVVVGAIDPDPRVSGGGIEKLKSAGIEVIVRVEEEACLQLNEAFIHRTLYKKPFGILKYAMTLDGKIATTTGHSAWVTSPESRHLVHQLRATCDAVIIGGNTVRRDNPSLTTHQVASHNPLRVVMSRRLDLPSQANLWDTQEVPTLVFTEVGANFDKQKQLLEQGVEVIELESLTPLSVMHNLYDRGLSCVLWECGGTLAAAAIAQKTIQKIMAFIAPKIIGGQMAPSPVGDLNLQQMTEALQLEKVTVSAISSGSATRIASDFLIEGYLS
jgi:diaminohydroxyphosphoribosylaminopyrimidine deaminase / 5-amino-6-(5-phosphoribosylamino)uracil reductase